MWTKVWGIWLYWHKLQLIWKNSECWTRQIGMARWTHRAKVNGLTHSKASKDEPKLALVEKPETDLQEGHSQSTFSKVFPLLATSFINRCGTIGLALLPMLLIEKKFSMTDSSIIMSAVQITGFLMSMISGSTSERWGPKSILLLSFVLSAVGMAGLPFLQNIYPIFILAVIASMGNSLFMTPARMILMKTVLTSERLEAIGWLRTAGNSGRVVSYALGAILAGLGLKFLFLFDGATSILATLFGLQTLKKVTISPSESASDKPDSSARFHLIVCTTIIGGFWLLYNLFIIGAAARYKLLLGEAGLPLFSEVMLVNSVFCSVFSVPLSRWAKDASLNMPFGILLTLIGAVVSMTFIDNKTLVIFGSLVFSVGEVLFDATSLIIVLQISTASSSYALIQTMSNAGRILAGLLAFPLVAYNSQPHQIFFLIGLPFIFLSLGLRHAIRKKELAKQKKG